MRRWMAIWTGEFNSSDNAKALCLTSPTSMTWCKVSWLKRSRWQAGRRIYFILLLPENATVMINEGQHSSMQINHVLDSIPSNLLSDGRRRKKEIMQDEYTKWYRHDMKVKLSEVKINCS
mmetsp:Transcript_27082/g.76210  ORF Transcript_27082/g.76210 Transcript_27082/m.76210 type:complete len:120 (-) Transcript_27082:27-386(-)